MRLSLNNTSEYKSVQYKKSLKDDNRNKVNFKGMSLISLMKKVSGAMDRNRILTSYSHEFDIESTLYIIRKKIGTSADVLYNHIKNDDIIKTALIESDGKLKFRNKKPIRLILDGIIYPITKIPFHILYFSINKLKKFDFVRNSNLLKSFEKSSFYHFSHSYLKKDDKLNALKGLMELGTPNTAIGIKSRTKSFLHNTAKTFDSRFGNYNGVHERALTRIVTGLIPAFFLANDAYNLSILCTNNKNDAKNERKLRFKQEVRRVLSNAYLQLITLGALSKFINKSKTWFVGVTIGTVLFSEIYSRLRTGKKIHFISAEEAKVIHNQEKQQALKEKLNKGLSFVLEESTSPIKVNLNDIDKLKRTQRKTKFKGEIQNSNIPANKKSNSQSLVTVKGLLMYAAGIIAAGFALRLLKNVPVGKAKFGDLFDFITKNYNNFYKKITMRPNHILKTDMDKIVDKMKKCGFETLADSYKKVVTDYQRLITIPKFITSEVINEIRKTGNNVLADYLDAFAGGKNSKSMLNGLRKDVIKQNLELFKRYLRKKQYKSLINDINKLTKSGEINYDKLKKLMNAKGNERFKDIFENIFSVDDNTLKLGLLDQAKSTLIQAKKGQLWEDVEQKTIDAVNAKSYYDLGIKKIPVLKDVIDFCIEPFKFIWGYATLPYKGIMNVFGMFKSHPRKAANDIDAVANAMVSLTKKLSMPDKDFTDMFNEKVVKGFNSTTMSKVVNSELSALAKSASIVTTISFRISDHYNMVMVKSAGEDKQEAKQKGKERFIQELSRFFWQQLFVKLFNNTFADTYNASLLGASIINTADTTIGEICTRKAVGIPIFASSKEEIIKLEKDNFSGNGLKSNFFKFMSKLTGKKPLSELESQKKKNNFIK